MIYDIVFEPKAVLHKKSRNLSTIEIKTKKIQTLISDMIKTMYAKDGVGLAAAQIGKSLQLCTIVKTYNSTAIKTDLCLINPTWTKVNKYQEWAEEGCLSVPKTWGKTKRYTKIKVKALNEKAEKIEFVAEGWFARIVQHEVDHLNGNLYIEKAKDLHELD